MFVVLRTFNICRYTFAETTLLALPFLSAPETRSKLLSSFMSIRKLHGKREPLILPATTLREFAVVVKSAVGVTFDCLVYGVPEPALKTIFAPALEKNCLLNQIGPS